jgi:hypothetical protein
VSHQVSHPYITTGQIIFRYILDLCTFWQQPGRQNILRRMIASTVSLQSAFNSFMNWIFHINKLSVQNSIVWCSAYWCTQHGPLLRWI